jgi:hypothetical protein
MDIFSTEMLSAAANLTSTAVAVVALILAFKTERQNHLRFERQLALSRDAAEASVRPILALEITDDADDKRLELWNHGGGPAVIRQIAFKRGNQTAQTVRELVELSRDFPYWTDYTDPPSGTWYLRANTADTLVQLTSERLEDDKVKAAASLLEELGDQLGKVRAVVTYEDVLGNVIGKDKELPE